MANQVRLASLPGYERIKLKEWKFSVNHGTYVVAHCEFEKSSDTQNAMNTQKITWADWWIYIGPGCGKQSRHRAVLHNDETVSTWSDPNALGSQGWAWHGTKEEFFKQFRKATP